MKILLQHRQTKHYLGRSGNWTEDPEAALAFLDEVRARDYSIYRRLPQADVVVRQETSPIQSAWNDHLAGPGEETHFYSHSLMIAKEKPSPVAKEVNIKVKRARLTTKPLLVHQMAETVGERTAPPVREQRKRPSSKPATGALLTEVEAKIDVGFGNALFIRGQGDGLRWDKGLPLDCLNQSTWAWSSRNATETVRFKLLLNDQLWAQGDDLVVEPGEKLEVVPVF